MPEDLSQTDQVVPVVSQELMRHRVPKQVRMQLHAGDRRILVAQCPDTTLGQRPTFPDEHLG